MKDEIVYSVSDSKNYIIFYSKSPNKTKLVNKRLSTVIEIKSKNFDELIDALKGELSDDEFASISTIYVND